jgi:hypothetical protein
VRLLTEHRSQLDALAGAVLKDDSLDEQQILAVTGLQAPPTESDGENGETAVAAAASTPAHI